MWNRGAEYGMLLFGWCWCCGVFDVFQCFFCNKVVACTGIQEAKDCWLFLFMGCDENTDVAAFWNRRWLLGFIRDSLSTNDLCCCLDILVNDVISEDIELLFDGIIIFRIASIVSIIWLFIFITIINFDVVVFNPLLVASRITMIFVIAVVVITITSSLRPLFLYLLRSVWMTLHWPMVWLLPCMGQGAFGSKLCPPEVLLFPPFLFILLRRPPLLFDLLLLSLPRSPERSSILRNFS